MLNNTISVFGHKNPDSDSVLSAIILAEFLNSRGENAVPYVQGKLNGESTFILNRYNVPTPQILPPLHQIAGSQIALVDTTVPNQLPEGVDKMFIRMIVDHHQMGGLTTLNTPEIWCRKIGACCTLLYELFKFYKVVPSPRAKALILCGILSDTLCFALPSTTDNDKKIAKKLARELNENLKMLWEEILTAKSDISGMTNNELLTFDSKEFVFGGKGFFIASLEINDSASVLPRMAAIKNEMLRIKERGHYFGVMFCVMDISKQKSIFVAQTDDNEKIEELFNVKFNNNEVCIHRIISRKKDIITVLQAGF